MLKVNNMKNHILHQNNFLLKIDSLRLFHSTFPSPCQIKDFYSEQKTVGTLAET